MGFGTFFDALPVLVAFEDRVKHAMPDCRSVVIPSDFETSVTHLNSRNFRTRRLLPDIILPSFDVE